MLGIRQGDLLDIRVEDGHVVRVTGGEARLIGERAPEAERAYQLAIGAKKATLSEAARVKREDRLLHDQELGVPGDPTASAVIWWPRAERGQSNRVRVRTRRAGSSTAGCRNTRTRGARRIRTG